MKRRVAQAVSLCLMAGLILPGAQGIPVLAAETEEAAEIEQEEESLVGELIFAQCEEEDFIPVLDGADDDANVVAKLFNNGSAEVVSEEEDGWLLIVSGNARGYVKAEDFATGEEADAIADEVAYNVAVVQIDELPVHADTADDSEVISVAYLGDEIEVVLYGDVWMKVALGDDVYGYICSDYVDYVTYYPVAKTLEELGEVPSDKTAEETVEEEETVVEEEPEEVIEETAVSEEIVEEEIIADSEEVTEVETYGEGVIYYDEDYDEDVVYYDDEAVEEEVIYYDDETVEEDVIYYDDETVEETVIEEDYYIEEDVDEDVYEEVYVEEDVVSEEILSDDDEGALADEDLYDEEVTDSVESSELDEDFTFSYYDGNEGKYVIYYYDSSIGDFVYEESDEPFDTEDDEDDYYYEEEDDEEVVYEETATTVSSDSTSTGSAIATYATQYVGNSYVWGGTSLTDGADCSGFVQTVYADNDISVARTAAEQAAGGTSVESGDLQEGDLLFYSSSGDEIDHVAIYIGDDTIVHAANSDRGIVTDYAYYDDPVAAVRYY